MKDHACADTVVTENEVAFQVVRCNHMCRVRLVGQYYHQDFDASMCRFSRL